MAHIRGEELFPGLGGVEKFQGAVQDSQHELEFVVGQGGVGVADGVQEL